MSTPAEDAAVAAFQDVFALLAEEADGRLPSRAEADAVQDAARRLLQACHAPGVVYLRAVASYQAATGRHHLTGARL